MILNLISIILSIITTIALGMSAYQSKSASTTLKKQNTTYEIVAAGLSGFAFLLMAYLTFKKHKMGEQGKGKLEHGIMALWFGVSCGILISDIVGDATTSDACYAKVRAANKQGFFYTSLMVTLMLIGQFHNVGHTKTLREHGTKLQNAFTDSYSPKLGDTSGGYF